LAAAIKGLGILLAVIGVVVILLGLVATVEQGFEFFDQDVIPFYIVGIILTLVGWLISKH
jgi:hypothetical protein